MTSNYFTPKSTKTFVRRATACLVLASALWLASAAHTENSAPLKTSWKKNASPLLQTDFPFQTACIDADFPAHNTAYKGVAMILENEAFMCFDTDLLRMSAGWTGNYITTTGVAFDGAHEAVPHIAGAQKFGTKMLPGWADANGNFSDPRPEPFGPVPVSQARWNGLYVVGDKVVLSYTVLGTKIYEQPSSVSNDGEIGFVRTFEMAKTKHVLKMRVCEMENATGSFDAGKQTATLAAQNGTLTKVALVGAPRGAKLEIVDSTILFQMEKGAPASVFKLVIWTGQPADETKFAGLLAGKPALAKFDKGGPAHWPESVVTKGILNNNHTPDGAFAVDQLTPPNDNPWKRRVRFGGFDFFSDGKRAALCTWDGDIWIVSGIDEGLEKLTWKRFASGGFETLGLKIVNDVIYTSGRNQITRYYDLNHDGEADYYENFNNEFTLSRGFHEFVFDLQTDRAGNFYTMKAGPVNGGGQGFGRGGGNGTITAHAGTMLKISKDGKKLEVFATGFRAPNGMCIGPNDEITSSDNEGTWVPSTPIYWIKKGGFYGVENTAHKNPIPPCEPAICWLSHADFDNSGSGQVWVTSDKWASLKGDLLHMSYGRCTLFLVLQEKIGDARQGGVVKLPLNFTSSCMRGRFNAKDGQLYISGLRAWQTSAPTLTGFDRVRATGKPFYSINGLHVKKGKIELSFTQALDPAYASDVQNYSLKRWNYERAEHYGSPEFSLVAAKKNCRDELPVQSAKLSPDGKTVTLEIADLKPVMQQSITFDLKAKDGTPIKQTIQHTINTIGSNN